MASPPQPRLIRRQYLDAETGLWCDDCMLPSRVRIWVGVTHNGHPRHIEAFEWCDDEAADEDELEPV